MKSLYVASTQGSGGKTTTAVGLCLALRARGLTAGYFKPVGTLASRAEGVLFDEDAAFVADLLELDDDPADVCPVVLDEDALHDVLSGSEVDAMSRVESAFGRIAAGKDVVVCEGLGEIWQGRFLRTSGAEVVRHLDLATRAGGQVRRRAPARRHHVRQGRPQAAPPRGHLQHGPREPPRAGRDPVRALPRAQRGGQLRRHRPGRPALGGLGLRDRRGARRHLRVLRAVRRPPRRDLHDRGDEPRARPALLPAHAQQGGHRRRRPRRGDPRRPRHADRRRRAHRRPTCPAPRCSSAPRRTACR